MLEKKLVKMFKDGFKSKTWTIFVTENSKSLFIPGWPDVILINKVTFEMRGLEFKTMSNQHTNQLWMEKVFVANDLGYQLVTPVNLDYILELYNEQ